MAEVCKWSVCFVPLVDRGGKFFGFSEFIAALALMVLAWTIADVRYRFRVRTAPLPLVGFTYCVIAAVGFLSLLTDWWRAEQWLIPRGHLVTPSGWQAALGSTFLATFLLWAWFAFIRPPVFGRFNAKHFATQLYRAVVRGAPGELPEIADELARSAKSLIYYSWQSREFKVHLESHSGKRKLAEDRSLMARRHAYDVLLLIADRKFCRHVVQSSPITALALFGEAVAQRKFDVPLDTFAKNVTSEAIGHRDSFAYHEVEGYYTGYVGYYKPLTKALYGNYELVDSLDQVFDVDYRERERWDAEQWEAFCRLVLVSFENCVDSGAVNGHPAALFRALHSIQDSVSGLHKVNGAASDWWGDDSVRRLRVVVNFAAEVIELLDEQKKDGYVTLRRREGNHQRDIYDVVAQLMFEIILRHPRSRSQKI